MGRSGWDNEPRGGSRSPGSRRPLDDDPPPNRSGSRGSRSGSSSRSRGYDDERDDYRGSRSRGYDERRPSSSARGGSSTRNRDYDDGPRRPPRPRGYDDDEPPRRSARPAPRPASRATWDIEPPLGRGRVAAAAPPRGAPARVPGRSVGGVARAGRFGASDDEDEEEEPSNSGATVGIVAAGVLLGVALGIVFAIGYYRASAPKLPGETPTQQATPATAPATAPSTTPHTFVPPSPGSAGATVRVVVG